jgi:hypothetical protein
VCWHKVPVIINALQDCDYLLFVDADAHFYSQELCIEEELVPLLGDRHVLMAQDIGSEWERWTPGLPNSGVILIHNSEESQCFLKAWDDASDVDESSRWQWPPSQRGLWNVVMPKYGELVAVHADYYMIHGRYGQYIRHYFGMTDEERTESMRRFYQSRCREEVMP